MAGMKFQFKIQPYQTEAVRSVVEVFAGQPYSERLGYTRDLGLRAPAPQPAQLGFGGALAPIQTEAEDEIEVGFKNTPLALSGAQLLQAIQALQARNNIKQSPALAGHLGACTLDVEMETGTGKTYVYIKTIFELNQKYGWSKFIIVVPSIAIREGIQTAFEDTQEHFMEHYGKKARFFIYNSKNLSAIDHFSSSAGINVMIINIQAFNARGADNRRIYERLDDFASRRPIDVIAANHPILIMDEPQKMGGEATQESLKNFKPLFCLNYSATHATQHNLVYVLDALDAYNQRLVKKIEVKGFDLKNYRGTDGYLYLEEIVISAKKPPMARLELEIKYQKSINRELRNLNMGDDLYAISNNMEQYRGYTVSEIDPLRSRVIFTNGREVRRGEILGDISEKDMRRIQIRETILSHFEKERSLFEMGIKTLSLFFIDEVAKYRRYDDAGNEADSEYGEIFEREYVDILNRYLTLENTPYIQYLQSIQPTQTHSGYFSIDKKGRMVNSEVKRGSDESDDVSAYDLILRDKKRLLSFGEPVRFIFSHSALREGWDNPNVFQICTLKHSDSATQKRQEVGRGLRLAVNQHGDRMDLQTCGDAIHQINLLTVVASESYRNFVNDLQKKIKEELYDRPSKATEEYFFGKTIVVNDQPVVIDHAQAKAIYRYLVKNDYTDEQDRVSDAYRMALQDGTLAPLPAGLAPLADGIHKLVQSVFDESALQGMIQDGSATQVKDNPLNDNFYKKEFQTLWNYINHKVAYTVSFDSDELIQKAIKHLDDKLIVSRLQYTVTKGEQTRDLDADALARGDSFKATVTATNTLKSAEVSQVKYDLIGKIVEGTSLTRKTVAAILSGLAWGTFEWFKVNPEEFITKAIRLINEQKATMIVEHISYNKLEQQYDSAIFTARKGSQDFSKAYRAQKHVQDFVVTDGVAEQSIERKFAQDLDIASEVCVYAKLPNGFDIPTPVGKYRPDWAIAFHKGTVKHIYFVAETKGSMDSMELRAVEQAKIVCAKKLFNEISNSQVRYHEVDSYQTLLSVMGKL